MYTPEQLRTYNALKSAAEKIGANNYRAQLAAHVRAGRKLSTFRFSVTFEHSEIVKLMPKVLAGKVSAEEAMSYLWDYNVERQRFAA